MKNLFNVFIIPAVLMPSMALAADPGVILPSPYELSSGVRSEAVSSEPKLRPALPASWKWSLAPLAASQVLDITSSYGMRELNPLLEGPHGEFGAKAAGVKIGVTAAVAGVEYLIVKAHPRAAKMLTTINWSGAALTSGFAIHNYSIR